MQPVTPVNVITGASTRKAAAAIRAAGRFSLCAQDESPPYTYVTVEGPVTIEEASRDEGLDRARRYLGPRTAADPTDGGAAARSCSG